MSDLLESVMSLYSFGHPKKSPSSEDLEAVKCHLLETLRPFTFGESGGAKSVSK